MTETASSPAENRPPRAFVPILGSAAVLLCGLALPACATAQTQDTPPATASHTGKQPMRDRFTAANTTHDGHLTRDQAQAGGLEQIARHFDQIDTGHRGYVTLHDVHTWMRQRKAMKTGAPPSGGDTL